MDQLRKQQVVVTSLEEKSGGGKFKLNIGSGLTDKDLVVFTRQFGTMIKCRTASDSMSRYSVHPV